MTRITLAALAALLLLPPLAAQEPAERPAAGDPLDAARAKDKQAQDALLALQKEFTGELAGATNDEARKPVYTKIRGRLDGFRKLWPGTDAALVALTTQGMIDLRVLGEVDRGLETLDAAYKEARARPAALLESSRVTPGNAGLLLAANLEENQRLDEAAAVYKQIAAIDGPESAMAKTKLAAMETIKQARIGRVIPTFSGPGLDGGEITPEQYRGKVTLIDFWATWCGPCMREMPNVVKVYKQYHEQGFDILGISLDKKGTGDRVRSVMKEQGMAWKQIFDGGGWQAKVPVLFGIQSIPATILIDRKGVIRHRDLRGAALGKAIAALLAEDGP